MKRFIASLALMTASIASQAQAPQVLECLFKVGKEIVFSNKTPIDQVQSKISMSASFKKNVKLSTGEEFEIQGYGTIQDLDSIGHYSSVAMSFTKVNEGIEISSRDSRVTEKKLEDATLASATVSERNLKTQVFTTFTCIIATP